MAPDITDARLIAQRVQAALRRIAAIQERIDEALAAAQPYEATQNLSTPGEAQRTLTTAADAA